MGLFRTWDDVISLLYHTYLPSRYGEHAKAMLELIPELREVPALSHLRPGLSHGTLFFDSPEANRKLYIWYEGENLYRVYFSAYSTEDTEEKYVHKENLLTTLIEYIAKM